MSSFESKIRKVENHLLEKGNITSWEAIKQYKATRLSAIIFDLRKKYDIDTVMIESDGSRYGRYYLRGKKNEG